MDLSIVVVAYRMVRELPRTITTLSRPYQDGDLEYEVIVVDNGSPEPVDPDLLEGVPGGRLIRLDPAPPSPALACNVGIEQATGEVIGVFIDGARMASPGLFASALRAMRLGARTIVTPFAYHLGDEPQMAAAAKGYDQRVEDELLASVDWETDGDQLFAISSLAGSSARGWFGPMGESNALFMAASLWEEVGGFDEVFARPGGGLVNHDLYRRACALPGVELVALLGEGTFHQFHGGAATGGRACHDDLWREYEEIRGEPHRPPELPMSLFGSVPSTAGVHLAASVEWLRRQSGETCS